MRVNLDRAKDPMHTQYMANAKKNMGPAPKTKDKLHAITISS